MKKAISLILILIMTTSLLCACGECKHEYLELSVIQAPTCSSAGSAKAVCTLCSFETTVSVEANPDAHKLLDASVVSASNCNVAGECEVTCELCQKKILLTLGLNLSEHTFESGKASCIYCDAAFNPDVTKINNRIKESDIRIASNNIYYHQPDSKSTYATRKPILLESFKYFDTDVLLLQECGYDRAYSASKTTWHDEIDAELVSMGYTYVDAAPKNVENATPIWYRADKLELVDSNFKLFETNSYNPESYLSNTKSYSSAVFKDKKSGETFACISTHFTWAADGFNPSPNELRRRNAVEVKNEVVALRNEYGKELPIFVMGDLNCVVGESPYTVLDLVMDDVKFMDGIKLNNTTQPTFHSIGSYPTDTNKILDHTFASGSGYNAVQYQYVFNEWSINSTDHIPLLLDIDLSAE